jgi:hypothetical protein
MARTTRRQQVEVETTTDEAKTIIYGDQAPAPDAEDPQPKPKRTRKTPAKDTAATAGTVDLHALLLTALKAEGIKPKVRWAPSGNYASLLVGDTNIGYVFKQTRNGIRVEPAATKKDLPRGAKGWQPGKRSEQFALVGVFNSEAAIAQAVVGLKAARDAGLSR